MKQISHICGIQKNGIDDLICKTEIETEMQRINIWTPRGEEVGGMNWEIGIDIKQVTSENLLYNSGNSTQHFVVTEMGRKYKKEGIYVYVQLIHFAIQQLEKEMATHSSVLAWRIPGTAEPGGLPSTGSHRVGHD